MTGREIPALEQAAVDEYRPGVSPGAALRQLCRTLGASGQFPTLKRLIEDELGEGNRASHERNMIFEDFAKCDPEAAAEAKMASFRRINRMDEDVPARH